MDNNYIFEALGALKADAATAKNQRATLFDKMEENQKAVTAMGKEIKTLIATGLTDMSARNELMEVRISQLEKDKIKATTIAATLGGVAGFVVTQFDKLKDLLT